jgi:hypothetical protein
VLTASTRLRTVSVVVWLAAACLAAEPRGATQAPRTPLPVEPIGRSGAAIYPAFEGWGPLRDGTLVFLFGYYNRNAAALDIPIGPDNSIEPGGPDFGQPTHFEARRQHGLFAMTVPKDLGTKRMTWTLRANGQTATISFWLNPLYKLDFFKHAANGNEPPVVRLSRSGSPHSGPPQGFVANLSGAVGRPLPLTLWASDAPTIRPDAADELMASLRRRATLTDPVAIVGNQTIGGAPAAIPTAPREATGSRPDVLVTWKKYRGPGNVSFTPNPLALSTHGDAKTVVEAASTATFDARGEYVLRAQVNDDSGEDGGGDQCCWTTALVKVTIR